MGNMWSKQQYDSWESTWCYHWKQKYPNSQLGGLRNWFCLLRHEFSNAATCRCSPKWNGRVTLMALVLRNLEATLLVHWLYVFGMKKRQKQTKQRLFRFHEIAFAHGRLGLRLLSSVPSDLQRYPLSWHQFLLGPLCCQSCCLDGQGGTLAQALVSYFFQWLRYVSK